MNALSFPIQASYWGQVFEVAVQRGVLAYLLEQKVLTPDHPSLEPWQNLRVSLLSERLLRALRLSDPEAQAWAKSGVDYLLLLGYGLGWTTLREWFLTVTKPQHYELAGLWCPLTLPGVDRERESERRGTAEAFQRAFPQLFPADGRIDEGLVSTGKPGRADVLLWLTDPKGRKADLVLVLELSYNVSPELLQDYGAETAHRLDLLHYANMLELRGAFAQARAEVRGEGLNVDPRLASFLQVFTQRDKPFYKLCQGSAYAFNFMKEIRRRRGLPQGAQATALAVTNLGLESLSAEFSSVEPNSDPRVGLMETLGEVYKNRSYPEEETPAALVKEMQGVLRRLVNALPKSLNGDLARSLKSRSLPETQPGQPWEWNLEETLENFAEPMFPLPLKTALEAVETTPELEDFFGADPLPILRTALESKAETDSTICLRNAHSAVVEAALDSAPLGELRVIALEGNPGIGKTTAAVTFLQEREEGFLFLYISPRVAINQDVTGKFKEDRKGTLAVTANADLINTAPQWYREQFGAEGAPRKEGAVVVNGADWAKPQDAFLYLTPEEEQEIFAERAQSRRWKTNLSERQDLMRRRQNPGVLTTIATGARRLLKANPHCQRLVLTAATQGYRDMGARTTVDSLSKFFQFSHATAAGKQERRALARRLPLIVAMVDEIAGDGAGALFCHRLADWLTQEFLDPFAEETPVFRVALILADASLSNETVLKRYLEFQTSGDGREFIPDKILISPATVGAGQSFKVTGGSLRIGRGRPKPVLHVLTNSFPASHLTIEYRLRLTQLELDPEAEGELTRLHQLIQKQEGEALLQGAAREIQRALKDGAEQVIFFAQDKRFLRELQESLLDTLDPKPEPNEIAILDQNVSKAQRKQFTDPLFLGKLKILLMTSSGSRGLSFPRADWIIARIPRFSLEASLMEVTQLIYRGRGSGVDPKTGQKYDGDRRRRRLVMLLEDFWMLPPKDETETAPAEILLFRQWLRRTSDLLTLLLMLRAAIHTRITGDAGLENAPLALVPVSKVGDEELIDLLGEDVAEFLYEAQVLLAEAANPELNGKLVKARDLVSTQFQRFDLIGKTPRQEATSYCQSQTLERLSQALIQGPLLVNPKPRITVLPSNIYCLGPYWLEDWRDASTEEHFRFQGANNPELQELSNILYSLSQEQALPRSLKTSAYELNRLLFREEADRQQEYATGQVSGARGFLIALPLNFPQFLTTAPEDHDRQKTVEEPELWRCALGRALTDMGIVLPPLANYDDFPWAATANRQALKQFQLLFQKEYFVTSYELNMLNLIFLYKTLVN